MSYLNVKKYLYLQWLFPIGIRCRTRIVLPLKWCQCTSVSNKLYFSHWIKMIKVFWHYYATFVGGGNGSPPQYSCLENPVDRGAWWAAVHRVAQSWARLKQLNMQTCIGEGNGNPLQYSCLENPVDRGAWWAAVHGVTQSQTWLKWLSSSKDLTSETLSD